MRPAADSELLPLTSAIGDSFYVLFGSAMNSNGSLRADASSRPTIIFFYGNGDMLANMVQLTRHWRKLGVNVLAVEYPGYGMSGGKPGEAAFYAAADSAYDYLVGRPDISKTRIIAAGQSLGTGVAIELAHRKPIAALALFSPYTNMAAMAARFFPWLPTSLILKHHFRNDQKIESLNLPILIAHGKHDGTIPVSMSEQLAKAAHKANVHLLLLESDHNDLFDLGGDLLDQALETLVARVESEK